MGLGVGVGDLQLAAVREIRRILAEAGGDPRKAVQLGLQKAYSHKYISESDLESLSKLCDLSADCSMGHTPPEVAHLEARRVFDEMLVGGQSTSAALAFASGSVGSYVTVDKSSDPPSIVYKKSNNDWESRLGNVGMLVGGAIGGTGGAMLGSAIGQIAGKIVDDCID
jgi:hypothetical protein